MSVQGPKVSQSHVYPQAVPSMEPNRDTWNWGAFCLSWLWLFSHSMKKESVGFLVLLLVAISLLDRTATMQNLVDQIFRGLPTSLRYNLIGDYIGNLPDAVIVLLLCLPIGSHGNAWARQHRHFVDDSQFEAVENRWGVWGIGAVAAIPLLCYFWSTVWMNLFHIVM